MLLIAAALAPEVASAQTLTLEQLAQRIEALERQVATLEQEKQMLIDATSPPPAIATIPPSVRLITPAADRPSVQVIEPQPVRALWSGGYMGVGAGWQTTKFRRDKTGGGEGPQWTYSDASSITAGPQFGYRWQQGPFVSGLEISGRINTRDDPAVFTGRPWRIAQRIDSAIQARAQIGLALDNWLLYGTVGIETRRGVTFEKTETITKSVHRYQETGPVFGAGIGYMFENRSSIELEYSSYNIYSSGGLSRTDAASDLWTVRVNQSF